MYFYRSLLHGISPLANLSLRLSLSSQVVNRNPSHLSLRKIRKRFERTADSIGGLNSLNDLSRFWFTEAIPTVKSLTSVLDILPTRQPLAGSSCTLRRSGAAVGEVINLIIACAASRSFETVSRPTLLGQGRFTYPGTGPTKSVPGGRAHHDVALLNAEFEVAASQEKGHWAGAAAGENDLWL